MSKRTAVILFAWAVALATPGATWAGYPVQPIGISVAGQPTFIAYVDDGETLPQVTVASNPDMTGYVGSCSPSTPFGEAHKFTCQLPYTTLAPGTYYWTFSWWKDDDCQTFFDTTYCYPELHVTAPFPFTVVPPSPPAGAGLVSPTEGAVVSSTPTFTIHAPGGATMHIYASDSTARQNNGSPLGLLFYGCNGSTANGDSNYYCTDNDPSSLAPGLTYYWWAVIDVSGASWVYGPRSFRIKDPTTTTSIPPAGGSSRSGPTVHTLSDASYLPSADHFTGRSIKQSRLSRAAYSLSKLLGVPRTVSVFCWSNTDWANVSGDSGDGVYSTLGFFSPLMPHWVQLSPTVCRAMETLLYHRPRFANRFTADAVETLTHEMMHALGVTRARYGANSEAVAECYGMQLSNILAINLGVPYDYANSLSRFNLTNYKTRPPNYVNTSKCREDGAWDIFKGHDSPPWHTYRP